MTEYWIDIEEERKKVQSEIENIVGIVEAIEDKRHDLAEEILEYERKLGAKRILLSSLVTVLAEMKINPPKKPLATDLIRGGITMVQLTGKDDDS